MSVVMRAMEKGLIPDPAIRYGIRKLCKERLQSLEQSSLELEQKSASAYIHALTKSPIAIHTQAANEFKSLEITMERAELKDGMNILELGCGWGSLTLAMAKKFPRSTITALSNSAPQREWIESEAKRRGFKNIRVVTRNIAEVDDLSAEFGAFDRVVSVEMFEHLRNYEALFTRLSNWLKDDGKLFVHIFTHKVYSYFFETDGEDNWMGRYFFTGGQMPAHHLLAHFQKDLVLEEQWAWDGTHYSKTSEAWLDRLDANRDEVSRIFKSVYGDADAEIWVQRWRVFFMSCAELFGYRDGTEWGVSHYRFCKRRGK
jgi:cyclopropane-fatty-acyl-phospholipid synthase